jgi:hypothetical protein
VNVYPSIRTFRSGHVTMRSCEISANSPFAERKQTADREHLCRIFLKKPSFSGQDFPPSWAHKSDFEFLVVQDIPSSDPVDQGEEDDLDTVGGTTERSLSPAPTIEETVPQMAQQTPVTAEPQASAEENRPELSATAGTRGPVAALAKGEAPMEARLVDIASLLGAPTVTVVRSRL